MSELEATRQALAEAVAHASRAAELARLLEDYRRRLDEAARAEAEAQTRLRETEQRLRLAERHLTRLAKNLAEQRFQTEVAQWKLESVRANRWLRLGGAINATDGRYTYHCYPADAEKVEIYQYTLMPMHMNTLFSVDELKPATLTSEFSFSKGVPLLKIPVTERSVMYFNYGPGSLLEKETRLYDLETDPRQLHSLKDPAAEKSIREKMLRLMHRNEAPPEAFQRVAAQPSELAAIKAL